MPLNLFVSKEAFSLADFDALVGENENEKSEDLISDYPRPSATAPALAKTGLNLSVSRGVDVDDCIRRIMSGDHWHVNMAKVVAHWVSMRWSNDAIQSEAADWTLAGYTADQTRKEVQKAINGARAKGYAPDIQADSMPPVASTMVRQMVKLGDWDMSRYVGEPPEITYLCNGTIPLGVPIIMASMGGIGKSFTALNLVWEVCYGNPDSPIPWKIMGGQVVAHGSAVMLTAEDGLGTVHRRLAAIDHQNRRHRKPTRLRVVPLPDAGGPMPLIEETSGEYRTTPAYDDLRRQLLAIADLRLVVIDPLQAFTLANVNADPAAGQFMWGVLSALASDTGATVVVCHHMRKTEKKVSTPADAREAVRGSTALIDGARAAYAFWPADDAEAQAICRLMNVSFQPDHVIKGAIVKTNDGADRSIATLIREDNGLLRDRTDDISGRQPGGEHDRFSLIDDIRRATLEGFPFTKTGQNGVFSRRSELSEPLRGISRNKLEGMVEMLLGDGVLVQSVAQKAGRGMKWLDIPGGPFARGEGEFAEGARPGLK